MQYEFPCIYDIDDVLWAIEDVPEINVIDKGDYKVINYMVSRPGLFPTLTDDMTTEEIVKYTTIRECRGLIFSNDGTILSRPYHKFFNICEREDTSLDAFRQVVDQKHWFMDKLDGSMVRPLLMPSGGVYWATKMGITDTGERARQWLLTDLTLRMKYEIFVLWYIARGYTPIFEWVSPDDRIVIDYGEPNLILTAIRHNNTGVYVDHDEMVEDAESNDIPCFAGRFMSGDIGALVDDIRNGEDSEGYVIRFDNGHMVKIKNEWYVTLHRSKELATNDRLIVKCILEESVDDLKPLLMESDLVRVVKMETVVNNALLEIVSSIVEHISTLGEIDRKTYAQTFSDYQFKSMVFAHHFGGKDNLLDMVRQHFLKTTTTNKKFDQEGRILLDNLA